MMTGIPVQRIAEKESGNSRMNTDLEGKVIGQDEAIKKVVKAIKRNQGPQGPQQTHWFLHLPGPYRRRKDATGQGPFEVHVRFEEA